MVSLKGLFSDACRGLRMTCTIESILVFITKRCGNVLYVAVFLNTCEIRVRTEGKRRGRTCAELVALPRRHKLV